MYIHTCAHTHTNTHAYTHTLTHTSSVVKTFVKSQNQVDPLCATNCQCTWYIHMHSHRPIYDSILFHSHQSTCETILAFNFCIYSIITTVHLINKTTHSRKIACERKIQSLTSLNNLTALSACQGLFSFF